ncbi:MAG TPA: exopolysaccharide biosynthesis protein [Bdellovibrionota bacterium]|jgi:hypothetical protein|nr:exopolysaccharide biosynthesis protein [Bdellovibrionota bacterium]
MKHGSQSMNKPYSITEILSELEAWATSTSEITIGQLVKRIGERGLGLVVVVLSIPFLQPVPMFGMSTVIGAVVMIMGLAIFLERDPWIPQKFAQRVIPTKTILSVCTAGRKVFGFTEKFIKPRGRFMHEGASLKKMSGAFIFLSAFLLALPLPIPGTNMPPAAAMFFLALGFIERDGYVIAFGYLCFWVTVAYFSFLAWASYQGASYALPFLQ